MFLIIIHLYIMLAWQLKYNIHYRVVLDNTFKMAKPFLKYPDRFSFIYLGKCMKTETRRQDIFQRVQYACIFDM